MYYLLKIRQPYTVCIDFTINNIACPILHIINLIISHFLTFVIIIKYDFIIFIVVHNYGLHLPQGGISVFLGAGLSWVIFVFIKKYQFFMNGSKNIIKWSLSEHETKNFYTLII